MGDSGNYAWGSENCTKKVRILDVVYNATSNELVRTKTLLKNTIVQIDGQPFKQWYKKKYGVLLGVKKGKSQTEAPKEEEKRSNHVICKQKYRESKQKLDAMLDNNSRVAVFWPASLRVRARVDAPMATCWKEKSCSSTRRSWRKRRRPERGQSAV